MTPVYNGEGTLAECIESVLAQTYRNWEYVIVDNRSTDRTREIAGAYARKDPRIRIRDNETFVSAIENHEICFREIRPESRYCKMVEADDWIFPECLERMVALAEASPRVGMVSAYRLEETEVTLDGLPYSSTVLSGREIARRTLLGDMYVFGTPSSVLLRCSVIRERTPFYDEADFPRHCDTAVCYELLREHDFGFVHQVLTFTRRADAVRTAVSDRLGSLLPEHLLMMQKYGRTYLDAGEYEDRFGEMARSYYRFLGASVLRRPGKEFWRYHRDFLRRLGLSPSRIRIGTGLLAAAALTLSRPFRSLADALEAD